MGTTDTHEQTLAPATGLAAMVREDYFGRDVLSALR